MSGPSNSDIWEEFSQQVALQIQQEGGEQNESSNSNISKATQSVWSTAGWTAFPLKWITLHRGLLVPRRWQMSQRVFLRIPLEMKIC